MHVALFARAWIEILDIERLNELFKVALFARAWIEITHGAYTQYRPLVALFARAWIEINDYRYEFFTTESPSLRGRGLK